MSLLVALALVLSLGIMAAPQSKVLAHTPDYWAQTYGGTDNDRVYSIQQTSDGGYILAGETQSFEVGNADFWVLKLDSSGAVTWQKTYGGSAYDCAYSIQQTSDGGYIVAGDTRSFGAGYADFWVLKLDESGLISADCPLGMDSDAILTDTSIAGADTGVSGANTTVIHSNTSVIPPDTDCEIEEQCRYMAAVAAFSASPPNGVAPLGVKFSDESTGTIDSRLWDFSDGKTSTAKNPSHVYAAPGRYTVTLTVTDPDGARNTATATITVIPMEEAEKPAKISASYLHISPPQVQPNQQVEISINVSNFGGKAGIYNAVLYINGNVESSQMVSVAPGSTQSAVFRVAKSTPGAYQVSLEGEVGQFTVLAPQKTSSFGGGGLGTGGIIP